MKITVITGAMMMATIETPESEKGIKGIKRFCELYIPMKFF